VSIPTTTPRETLGHVVSRLREQGPVDAIGIASFGPVDLRRDSPTYGRVTSTPKPGWRGADLVGTLSEAFGVPVGFDTDVNGAALAEGRWGAARGLDTFVYVTVGTGIGGGAVISDRLAHGLLHPEMGHVMVRRHPDDRFAGTCPYHGDCLEGLACGPAIAARWGRPSHALGPRTDAAVAMQAWYLAEFVCTLAYVVSPQRVIIGGGVAQLPGLLAGVRARVVERLAGYIDSPAITQDIDSWLVPPALGGHAGVLGAIALAQRAAS
jgi:fructokinase